MVKDGRHYRTQQTHYLRRKVAFNSAPSGATVLVGTLQAGALVLRTSVAITEAFNAGTSNDLIVGTAADDDALVATAGVSEAAVGLARVAPATLGGFVAAGADTDVYAKYTQTGAAATTGRAVIVVEYAADNDR